MLEIAKAQQQHYDAIWDIFHSVVQAGDTYTYDPNTTKEEALKIWCNDQVSTFVALSDGQVVGTYVIKPNFPGLGSHIANCSYMVSENARGLGVGRLMAEHSLNLAKASGCIGVQFNIVVSTNLSAVKLWKSLGFEIIGTTPKSFRHQTLGLVDSHIMYKTL